MDIISSASRRNLRRDLARMRPVFDTIYALYPTESDCTACGGYDPFTGSGYDPSCSVCGGSGKVTTWAVWEIRARIAITNPERLAMFGVPPGAELGDLGLYIGSSGLDIIQKLLEQEQSYLYIQGQRYRPTSYTPVGVGREDEYRVECNRFKPEKQATGY